MSDNKNIFFSGTAYIGLKGRIIANIMNMLHKSMHIWFADKIDIKDKSKILDVGCGGGGLIKELVKRTIAKVYGIDCSKDMVRMSKINNKKWLKKNRVEVVTSSVSHIPYSENTFDIITAFETIQFWPNIVEDIKEIKRVLKKDGMFIIMDRLTEEKSKWYTLVQLKTIKDYKNVIEKAGFKSININTDIKKGWILIKSSI